MKLFLSLSLFLSVNAFATINVPTNISQDIFKSIDTISKIENLEIIKTDSVNSHFLIDDISCVFESYNACSFFTDINGARKMVVATDGTAKFMQSLADAGIAVDDDNARMDVTSVACTKTQDSFSCTLEEYNP